jgi:hypothetical protein
MKRIIIILIVLLPVCVFSQDKKIVKQKLEAGKVETKMMVIKGENAWLNTGFVLNPSDVVTIKATGEVFFSAGDEGAYANPNGYLRSDYEQVYFDDFNQCGDPLDISDIGHAALIAKDRNGMFAVGINRTFTNKTGALYIGINDCSFKGPCYNSGQFEVNIKVVHPK